MSELKGCGPAFPFILDVQAGAFDPMHGRTVDAPQRHVFPGMTLRDYFAAKAMFVAFSELSRQVGEGELSGFGWDSVASNAYRIADAMLTERQK